MAVKHQLQAEEVTTAQHLMQYYLFRAHGAPKFYFVTLRVGSDQGIRLAIFFGSGSVAIEVISTFFQMMFRATFLFQHHLKQNKKKVFYLGSMKTSQ